MTTTKTTDDDVRGTMTETWINVSSTDVEFDVDVYLQQHLGHRHHSAVDSASLTAVYVLILLTGVQVSAAGQLVY